MQVGTVTHITDQVRLLPQPAWSLLSRFLRQSKWQEQQLRKGPAGTETDSATTAQSPFAWVSHRCHDFLANDTKPCVLQKRGWVVLTVGDTDSAISYVLCQYRDAGLNGHMHGPAGHAWALTYKPGQVPLISENADVGTKRRQWCLFWSQSFASCLKNSGICWSCFSTQGKKYLHQETKQLFHSIESWAYSAQFHFLTTVER